MWEIRGMDWTVARGATEGQAWIAAMGVDRRCFEGVWLLGGIAAMKARGFQAVEIR